MEDTVSKKNEIAAEAARLLHDLKGKNTLVLDISSCSSFTDFFIITTANSQGHMQGLVQELEDFLQKNDIYAINRESPKSSLDSGWILFDCGDLVFHIMNQESRDFYELEKIWFKGELVYSAGL